MTRLSLASIALAACYGAAPPRPAPVPLPALSDDATLEVRSTTRTADEEVERASTTCPLGKPEGDPSCTVTRYVVREPVTRTTTTMTYGPSPITYAQFQVLTDAERDAKLARLDALSRACRRANVPRWIGAALMIGGAAGVAFTGNKGVPGLLSWGALGAGTGSYALGYFALGGRDCVRAEALHAHLDLQGAMDQTTVEGADRAAEMKALADRFNAEASRRLVK